MSRSSHFCLEDPDDSWQILGSSQCDPSLLPPGAATAMLDASASAADLLAAATRDLGSAAVDQLLELLKVGMEDECCICLDAGGDCITRW